MTVWLIAPAYTLVRSVIVRTADGGTGWIALSVNPRRPDRVEPRVVKRSPKSYRLMTQPREERRQALMKQTPAA